MINAFKKKNKNLYYSILVSISAILTKNARMKESEIKKKCGDFKKK